MSNTVTKKSGSEWVFKTTDSDLTRYNNTTVVVIRPLTKDECDIEEAGVMYKVRFFNGLIRDVFDDELLTPPWLDLVRVK